jgi:ribosomal protein L11 methyltransferase
MEKYLGDNAADKKVLDVGCGSGILSIGAALLGSTDILGIEIDTDAVRVANENIELNNVGDKVKAIQGDLTEGVSFKADIIVANLMADLVMKLSKSAGKHLKKDGIYISSGILVEKKEVVSEAIKAAGFEIIEIAEDGEWCAIAAKNKKSLFGRLFG